MTGGRGQDAVRRPVVVTAILLVAVAVLLVALRSWLDRPVDETGIGGEASIAVETVEPAIDPEPTVDQLVESAPPDVALESVPPYNAPSEPLRVVMLPARLDNPDPAAAVLLDAVRQATLRALRGMPNIEVFEISSAEVAAIVPPNGGPLGEDNLVFRAISQRYGADNVAEISERSAPEAADWSIKLRANRATGGWTQLENPYSKTGAQAAGNDVESIGRRFAEFISRNSPGTRLSSSSTGEERSILLDPTRSEQERLQALLRLPNDGFDSGTLAAAVDLANRSSSAETRQGVWSVLRSSAYDATLAQPFSYALQADQDATVRREAALGLGAYLNIVGSQAALEQAARNDSSADVRLAARLAMMDYDQQKAFRRETLLDRSLTPAERIAPIVVSGISPVMPFSGAATAEEATEVVLAYAEIVSATDDVDLKLWALSALQGPIGSRDSAIDPEIVRVLVESEESADAQVRRAALQAMRRHSDVPEIRTVLESVVEEEPRLAELLGIRDALERRSPPSVPAR